MTDYPKASATWFDSSADITTYARFYELGKAKNWREIRRSFYFKIFAPRWNDPPLGILSAIPQGLVALEEKLNPF